MFVCQVWCSSIQGIYSLLLGVSICQSMFICQVLCTGIQGIYALLIGGSISQSRFVCQVWCTGIQGIYSSFTGGSIQSMFICQVFVYWYSRHLCSINWGVYQPKYVCLPRFVYWYSRNLCSIHWGILAKVGSSAKCGVAVFKASILDWLGGSIGQSRFICQVWCSSIQGIYSLFTGGSICQSMFVCQVLCTGIQGIYALLIGGSIQPKYVHLPSFCVAGIQGIYSLNWGVHLPKYVHLPSLVYWYSRHLCFIYLGGPSAKVCSSAKFCVLVFKASMLY